MVESGGLSLAPVHPVTCSSIPEPCVRVKRYMMPVLPGWYSFSLEEMQILQQALAPVGWVS